MAESTVKVAVLVALPEGLVTATVKVLPESVSATWARVRPTPAAPNGQTPRPDCG